MYIYSCEYPRSDGTISYYIGQSTKSPEESTDYYGSGVFPQNYEKKYGKEYIKQNVKKKILRRNVKDKKTLDYLERLYVKNYRNKYGDLVVNIADGGEGASFPGEQNPRYDHTIYHFRNVKTKETFKGTRYNFTEKYGLDKAEISLLIRGEKEYFKYWVMNDSKIKSVKDTRCKLSNAQKGSNHSQYDHTIYHFRNVSTGEAFKGTKHNFVKKYNLHHSNVGMLIRGKVNHCKYWVLNDSEIKSVEDTKRIWSKVRGGSNNPNYNVNSIEQIHKRAFAAGDVKVLVDAFRLALKNPNHKNYKKFIELRDKHTIKEATADE